MHPDAPGRDGIQCSGGEGTGRGVFQNCRYFGAEGLAPYIHLDENHNIVITIDGHNIPYTSMQEKTETSFIDKAGRTLKKIIKGNNRPKPKTLPTVSEEEFAKGFK